MSTNNSEVFPDNEVESQKESTERPETEQQQNDLFSDSGLFDGLKLDDNTLDNDGLLTDDPDPDNCGICSQPLVMARMLHCLHVFCEQCLEKKLMGEDGGGGGGDAGTPNTAIICPTCGYETKVGIKKLSALPLDVTKVTNIVNDLTINLHCTCCTAKELAKSRCNTCHNLLCNHCDSAHHYMRCFESHKVVELDDLRKQNIKLNIEKPMLCELHNDEKLIFYCNGCMMIICKECIKIDHQEHNYMGILESELQVRKEMADLLKTNEMKIDELINMSTILDNNLQELAHQRSTARDLINESYQSYKAVLEKCRDDALNQLNKYYHERELLIMKENDEIGKQIGNIKDAQLFTKHFLQTSNVNQLMYLRKLITERLMQLNANSDSYKFNNNNYNIEFHCDFNNFEKIIKNNFGLILTEKDNLLMPSRESSPILLNSTLTPSTPILPTCVTTMAILPNLPQPLTMNGIVNCSSTTTTNGSPISSMQSSFDGDLSSNLSNFNLTQSPTPQTTNNSAQLSGFNSIAEYNLAQLATLAENTNNSSTTSPTPPPPSSSATSQSQPSFTLADLLTSDTAYKNLASLVKLGLTNNDNSLQNGTIIGRSTSPASSIHNLTNNLINGFGGLSSSTSPLLSTPDDLIISTSDQLTNILPSTPGTNLNNSTTHLQTTIAAAAAAAAAAATRSNKVSPMQIRSKFGQLGPNKGQFNSPHGFCLGLEEDIIVADTNNHRIQVFDKAGVFKFQFGTSGKDEGQLWYPRKVAVMRTSGKYVVCDRGNERSRMQIFTKNGHFLKKIAIRYIDIVAGLAVTGNGEIVAVDSVSPTVFIISENGDLVRWFDCSDFMREPSDIAIHGKEFYVCDFKGHNVVVFSDEGHFKRRIGCESITNFPNGIDISDAGDILIGDSHGNRFHVAVFSREGCLISEFECPYVKVSRCCGLKITSEGYVVTLAKNNHHVLVLNTLYIL